MPNLTNIKSAEEFLQTIYQDARHGNSWSSEAILEAIENFRPEYKAVRIAAQYGEEAKDMYECVEHALHHFNPKWSDPNWIYFTIGGKKTCQDVLNWLDGVIKDHIKYRTEHAND